MMEQLGQRSDQRPNFSMEAKENLGWIPVHGNVQLFRKGRSCDGVLLFFLLQLVLLACRRSIMMMNNGLPAGGGRPRLSLYIAIHVGRGRQGSFPRRRKPQTILAAGLVENLDVLILHDVGADGCSGQCNPFR
jgi:hypothetical protein